MLRSFILRRGELEVPLVMKVLIKEACRTWRWAATNAWIIAGLLAMSHVNGDTTLHSTDTGIGLNLSPAWSHQLDSNSVGAQPSVQKLLADRGHGMGVDTFGTFLSLCFIFIVGVSTGLWWKANQQVEQVVESREIVLVEPPTPTSSTSTNGTSSSPRICRNSTVGALTEYNKKEIEEMTDNFKLELGRGGQGVVYFANSLPEEPIQRKLAVKRLQKGTNVLLQNPENRSQEVVEKEFWAELNTISRLHHRNLVALLGFCIEGDDLFLVYEYMAKGSLDQHLHKNLDGEDVVMLDWKARMRCAAEVAQGLEYLHSHANPSLVHRDVKSGNILFDDDMQAKIADFGLSKPLPPGHQVTVSTRVRGTHGYVDPVYLINGVPCDKNDVYSYGVVLLELITGRRAIQQRVSLVTWCKDFIGTDEPVLRHLLPRMVDSRISQSDLIYEQLYDVVRVAQMCVEEKQELRPSMKDVVVWLHNANCKDYSSSESSLDTTLDFSVSNGSTFSSFERLRPPVVYTRTSSGVPTYEIRDNTILVKCIVGNHQKIALRCKIWPTPKNFGLNKVEATLNGAFLWKKGLWWYNARSSRDFMVDDEIKLRAEWHVALRTSKHGLAPNDPRRSQGPFCVEYLALKDEGGKALIEYHGDRSPLPPLATRWKAAPKRGQSWRDTKERSEKSPSKIRSGSGSGTAAGSGSGTGSGSAERRSINQRRSMVVRRSVAAR